MLIREATVKARKRHQCLLCLLPIIPGMEHRVHVYTGDGRIGTQREHTHCASVAADIGDDQHLYEDEDWTGIVIEAARDGDHDAREAMVDVARDLCLLGFDEPFSEDLEVWRALDDCESRGSERTTEQEVP